MAVNWSSTDKTRSSPRHLHVTLSLQEELEDMNEMVLEACGDVDDLRDVVSWLVSLCTETSIADTTAETLLTDPGSLNLLLHEKKRPPTPGEQV